jgi:hypothetical protein
VAQPNANSRLEELHGYYPSWPWASVTGPLNLQDRLVNDRCHVVQRHKSKNLEFCIREQTEESVRDRETEFVESGSWV